MNKNPLTKTPVVCALALLCCLLWGSAFPCIKIGYRLFEIPSDSVSSQILFAGIRFTLAGVLTILFGSLIRRKPLIPKKSSVPLIIKLSLVQTVLQYVFFYIGLANASGVKSSIIEASNVFLAILIAALVFRYEKLTWLKIAGCAVGFAGVVVINLTGEGLDTSMKLSGEGAILLSTVAYALSSGLIKKYSEYEDPVILSGYQFFAGGIVMAAGGAAFGGHITVSGVPALLLLVYLALISSVAYTVWGLLLKYNPVGRVTVFVFTNSIFGVLLSALLLGERNQAFGLRGIVALVLVSAGILIVNRSEN